MSSPKQPKETVPATAISNAPDTSEDSLELDERISEALWERFQSLQQQLEAAEAEVERLTGAADNARAKLIQPYAWAVLAFVGLYGAGTFALLLLQGFKVAEFQIDNAVMGVIVGSTAVAAIGLVHTIVKGLFPDSGSK